MSGTGGEVRLIPVRGIGEVRAGDDLADLITAAVSLYDGDVVVVAQKVVSKAEGARALPHVGESAAEARRRVALQQARRVLVDTGLVTVVETPHGLVCAAAGVDASNTGDGSLTLLPEDPDDSAARLAAGLRQRSGATVAVVVGDTFGRPWRYGQTDVAIGAAGLTVLRDERGRTDRDGRLLDVTLVAVADELAGAADLVRGKADGVPVVVVRGWAPPPQGEATSGRALRRPRGEDLFPYGRGALAARLASADPAAGATRPGPPSAREWDEVVAAAGAGAVSDGAFVTDDGIAAGLALACLLDLGYPARLQRGTPLRVVVD